MAGTMMGRLSGWKKFIPNLLNEVILEKFSNEEYDMEADSDTESDDSDSDQF